MNSSPVGARRPLGSAARQTTLRQGQVGDRLRSGRSLPCPCCAALCCASPHFQPRSMQCIHLKFFTLMKSRSSAAQSNKQAVCCSCKRHRASPHIRYDPAVSVSSTLHHRANYHSVALCLSELPDPLSVSVGAEAPPSTPQPNPWREAKQARAKAKHCGYECRRRRRCRWLTPMTDWVGLS